MRILFLGKVKHCNVALYRRKCGQDWKEMHRTPHQDFRACNIKIKMITKRINISIMEHHHQEWKPELRVNSSFAFKLPWQLFTLPLCWPQSCGAEILTERVTFDNWDDSMADVLSPDQPYDWPHTDSMTDPLIDPITDQNCEVKAVLHSCDVALQTISPNDCNDPNGIIILMIIVIESGTDQNSCVQTSTDVTSLFPRMPSFIFPTIMFSRPEVSSPQYLSQHSIYIQKLSLAHPR